MSHSVVLVLSPKLPTRASLEEALAPYNENMEVAKHREKCYCCGGTARDAARESAAEKFGTFDSLRESFNAAHPYKRDQTEEEEKDQNKAWRAHIKGYVDHEAAALAAHPKKDEPKKGCAQCEGRGWYMSTYNPKSKWDWYAIGGRWAGMLSGLQKIKDWEDVYKERSIGEESAPVKYILANWSEKLCPFAILTPDGWCQRGEMGWWGVVSDEDDNWPTLAKETLEKYPDYTATAVDVHI